MLATFNEILFKMPQANSMRFHVEMQLKNCSEESVLFPCLPWALLRPTQKPKQKEDSHATEGGCQVSHCVSDLATNSSLFSENTRKNVL